MGVVRVIVIPAIDFFVVGTVRFHLNVRHACDGGLRERFMYLLIR